MGSQKGAFGSLLMLAGTALAIFAPPLAGLALIAYNVGALTIAYAGSLLAQAALEEKLAKDQMGIQSTTRGTQAALPILYGTNVKTGSVIADIFAGGTNGEYLYTVNVLSVAPDNGYGIGGVKNVILASEGGVSLANDLTNGTYSVAGNGGSGNGVAYKYQGLYWYNAHTGTSADNAVDPMMNDASSQAWPTTSKGNGLAYMVNKFKYDFADDANNARFSALPDLRFIVDGIKVADIRDEPVTYAASDNPALNLYDYLTSDRYGLGIDSTEIDSTSFISAANYCDGSSDAFDLVVASGTGLNTAGSTTVATADDWANPSTVALLTYAKAGDTLRITSGANAGDYTFASNPSLLSGSLLLIGVTTNFPSADTNMSWEIVDEANTYPYIASGALMTDAGHRANIEALLAAMRGSLYWENGKFFLWIRQPETAETFELDASTNIDSIEIFRPGSEDTPNVVEITFLNPHADWTVDTIIYPEPGASNPYLTEDNNIESRLKYELPLSSHPAVAFGIAEIMLKEARNNTVVKLKAREEALKLNIGSVVKLTDDSAGWDQKLFWVMSIGIAEDNTIDLTLQEYDSNVYTTAGTYLPNENPGTNIPSPLYVPSATSLTLLSDDTTRLTLDSGDRMVQQIKATWTQSAAYNLDHEKVFYKKASASEWQLSGIVYPFQASSGSQLAMIGPVEPGVTYNVGIISVNKVGVKSDMVSDSVTTGTVPDLPAGGANTIVLFVPEVSYTGLVSMAWSAQTDDVIGVKVKADMFDYPTLSEVLAQTMATTSPIHLTSIRRSNLVYVGAVAITTSGYGALFLAEVSNVLDDDELPPTGEIASGGYIPVSPVRNSSGGAEGTDDGWMYWGGEDWLFTHPNGASFTVPAGSITLTDLATGTGSLSRYLAYVGTDTTRFGDGLATLAKNIVAIRRAISGGWEYLGTTTWTTFTPNENDSVIGSVIRR